MIVGTALLALTVAAPALGQDKVDTGAGVTAGAATGGTLGFIFGGPIGAIVGGFTGAVIGGSVSDAAITYAGSHPVEQVYIDSDIDVGFKVSDTVKVYPIEGDDAHGYFYANNRVWIVDLSSGEVVASPGFVIPERAVAYVKANPTASVTISSDVGPGFVLDADVAYADVPDVKGYSYLYVNDRPAVVDARTRTIVWIE
jgi:outer membrane lipoprotein SlyB